jgi:hypothetical protein
MIANFLMTLSLPRSNCTTKSVYLSREMPKPIFLKIVNISVMTYEFYMPPIIH